MLLSAWNRFLEISARIGIDPDDSDELRLRKTLLVRSSLMICGAGIFWGILYFWLNEPWAGLIPLGYSLISTLNITLFAYTRRCELFRFGQLALILLLPFFLLLVLGGYINSSAVILWSTICPFGALIFNEPRNAVRWFFAYLALVVISGLAVPWLRTSNNLPPAVITLFFVLNVGVVTLFAFVLLYHFIRQRETTLDLLRQEQAKSERLLLNVLPKPIADILKEKDLQAPDDNTIIAQYHENVSVLFADVVGFTPLATEIDPVEMVRLLNEVFSNFDRIVSKHGLEKICTIGDSYMVAAGVPHSRDDHAVVLVQVALEMRDYLCKCSSPRVRGMQFRIGLNSGPVIAGVIGSHKFHYDLWGDVVNVASRMESQGAPGKIQISRSTYNLVKDHYICYPRGLVVVKGKGEMETWFVEGPRPVPLTQNASNEL